MNETVDKPPGQLSQYIKGIGAFSILVACFMAGFTIANSMQSSEGAKLRNERDRKEKALENTTNQLNIVTSAFERYRKQYPGLNDSQLLEENNKLIKDIEIAKSQTTSSKDEIKDVAKRNLELSKTNEALSKDNNNLKIELAKVKIDYEDIKNQVNIITTKNKVLTVKPDNIIQKNNDIVTKSKQEVTKGKLEELSSKNPQWNKENSKELNVPLNGTASFFDNDIVISLHYIDRKIGKYGITVVSSGYPEMVVDKGVVGKLYYYNANKSYEILGKSIGTGYVRCLVRFK